MTVEEIKANVSMREVLARYGVPVSRSNMCCCPIHKERHPSMQVFKDGYKCYSCGARGDVFRFIQEMEGCTFKEAFISLGGTYEQRKSKKQRILINKKFSREKYNRDRAVKSEEDFTKLFSRAISICRDREDIDECIHALPWLEYVWEEKYIREEYINKADVIRVCKRIERIANTV